MSDSTGFGAVSPVLACGDVLATARWYRDVLGFVIDEKWTGESWGMLWAEGSQVFLSLKPDLVKTAKGQQLLIAAEDVDSLYARHKANGATIISPLQTHSYGLREYTVEDPNGLSSSLSDMGWWGESAFAKQDRTFVWRSAASVSSRRP